MKLRDLEDAASTPATAPAFHNHEKPGPRTSPVQVRPAGPDAMADAPGEWDTVDEAADESFPASDPPSNSPPERRATGGGRNKQQMAANSEGADGALSAGAEEDNNP